MLVVGFPGYDHPGWLAMTQYHLGLMHGGIKEI
jgi:hypothetical protein